jgi:VWFA-related protein
MRVFPLSLACAIALAISGLAQTKPTIRTETQLVEVDTIATEGHGNPVTNLRSDELRIFEDGRLRPLTHFSLERVEKPDPESTHRLHELARHKSPNAFANFSAETTPLPLNGCTVLLIDALNTPLELQAQARDELRKFVETVDLSKPLAVFALDSSLHQLQDFTVDRALLKARIAQYGIHSSNLQPEKRATNNLNSDLTDWRVQRSTSALLALSLQLQGLAGRKSILWFSGAFPAGLFPTDLTGLTPEMEANYGGYLYGERRDYADIVAQMSHVLASSDIAVYPVDAQGLQGTFTDASQFSVNFYRNTITQNIAQRRQSMIETADLTGGQAFYNRNDIARELTQAYHDGDTFYALAFTPAKREPDSKVHKIRVSCTRSGVQLHYRKSYYAQSHASQAAEREQQLERFVLSLKQPANGIPLMGQIDRSESQRLKLWIDASGLSVVAGKSPSYHLDIAVATFDKQGNPLTHNYADLTVRVKPEHLGAIKTSGLSQTLQFNRTPQTAEVRIALRDIASGKVGTLEIPLTPAAAARQ